MKRPNKILWLLLIIATIGTAGCTSSKKGNCGCPSKKGLVGY